MLSTSSGALKCVFEQIDIFINGMGPHNYAPLWPFQANLFQIRHRKIMQVGILPHKPRHKDRYYVFPKRVKNRTFRGKPWLYPQHPPHYKRVYNSLNHFTQHVAPRAAGLREATLYVFEKVDVIVAISRAGEPYAMVIRVLAYYGNSRTEGRLYNQSQLRLFYKKLKEGVLWIPDATALK
jgi:hypothetical protein